MAETAAVDEDETAKSDAHVIDALVPLLMLIFGTVFGLFYTGYDAAVWSSDFAVCFLSKEVGV